MATAAAYLEIQKAQSHLEAHGYQVSLHDKGHLIVQDRVMRCGHGPQAGHLIPAGFQSVAVRNYAEAFRFVSDRS